jgi:DNA-binding NarL/FixJ family response regulator
MKCLETRKYVLPTVTIRWRRYKDEAGNSTTTCEVPTDLWNRIAIICGETGLVITRVAVTNDTTKREKAMELIAQGWKSAAIAHELGLNESTANRYKRERK